MEKRLSTKKTSKKKALGRGLESLLKVSNTPSPAKKEPTKSPALELKSPAKKISDEELIHQLDIEQLKANEEQPRKHFSEEALRDLTRSIEENGIMQPIVAKRKGESSFEIIAGERRWRAAQAAGLKKVPVILKKVTDQAKLELAIIENIQRDNLNPVEEGEAYSLLAEKYGLTQKEIAKKVGKERATVANLMRITQLSHKVKQLVSQGTLSLGHAKVLLSVEDPKLQEEMSSKITRLNLSVRATESMIKNSLEGKSEKGQKGKKSPYFSDLEDQLRKKFGTKVKIDEKNGKGSIEIKFHSVSQMNELLDKMMS